MQLQYSYMQIVNSACRVRQLTPPVVKNNIRVFTGNVDDLGKSKF